MIVFIDIMVTFPGSLGGGSGSSGDGSGRAPFELLLRRDSSPFPALPPPVSAGLRLLSLRAYISFFGSGCGITIS